MSGSSCYQNVSFSSNIVLGVCLASDNIATLKTYHAFDTLMHEAIWRTLERKDVPNKITALHL